MLKHCHIASYGTRQFPGSDPATVDRLRPYFEALRDIGYTGGVSCECAWGKKEDLAKNLETALATMRSL
jgi:sugar phosphate isomerase/epimerase